MEKVIEDLRRNSKPRTVETYRCALNCFRRFRKNEDLPLNEFDSQIVKEYEQWLLDQGLIPNTTSFYIRKLRAVYNRAVKMQKIPDVHPFTHVYTGMARTKKRAVDMSVINRMANMVINDDNQRFARDMFLFSFYTQGMSFVDMAYLKNSDIKGDVLSYQRQKTGQRINIKWTPYMQEIVSRNASPTGYYLLPIIRRRGKSERSQLRQCQYNVNTQLGMMSEIMGLQAKLTMYVARHSWASIAYSLNIPMEVISMGMGHHSERTTRIYLKDIDNGRLAEANQQVYNKVMMYEQKKLPAERAGNFFIEKDSGLITSDEPDRLYGEPSE
jgi:site-specific recombinase XerD